jgi:hypothetical protein
MVLGSVGHLPLSDHSQSIATASSHTNIYTPQATDQNYSAPTATQPSPYTTLVAASEYHHYNNTYGIHRQQRHRLNPYTTPATAPDIDPTHAPHNPSLRQPSSYTTPATASKNGYNTTCYTTHCHQQRQNNSYNALVSAPDRDDKHTNHTAHSQQMCQPSPSTVLATTPNNDYGANNTHLQHTRQPSPFTTTATALDDYNTNHKTEHLRFH